MKDSNALNKYGEKGKDGVILITLKKENKNDRKNSNLIILDGKEISQHEMDAISPIRIKSVEVLKDKVATEIYGEKGKDGVILITSFKNTDKEKITVVESDYQQKNTISISNNGARPLYILDGKEISKKEMEAIDPSTFGHIEILKDASATKKYGKKGENGVVIITSKKE